MASITISDLLTIIFVLVDDWYQVEGLKLLQGKPGKRPEFTDSEMMTLMLAQEYIPYTCHRYRKNDNLNWKSCTAKQKYPEYALERKWYFYRLKKSSLLKK